MRIGDLVENAGAVADVPIFRAPDLGQTGAVPVDARASTRCGRTTLIGLDTGGLSEVVVTRAEPRDHRPRRSRTRIARALAGAIRLGDAQNLAVIFDRELRAIHVEPSVTGELARRAHATTSRAPAASTSPSSCPAARARARCCASPARATETVEAATLTRPLARGEVVKASDVAIERRPKAEVGGDVIADRDQAVGLAAARRAARRPGAARRPT